jgi:hypothetical protein
MEVGVGSGGNPRRLELGEEGKGEGGCGGHSSVQTREETGEGGVVSGFRWGAGKKWRFESKWRPDVLRRPMEPIWRLLRHLDGAVSLVKLGSLWFDSE